MSEDAFRDADLFRYCVYCGADCHADEPEHAADCPSVTGLYPVRREKHCETCTCEPGMRCIHCGAELGLGDVYMHREIEPANELTPGMGGAAVYECICVGCAASDATGEEQA